MAFLRRVFSRKLLAYASGGTAIAVGGGYWFLNSGPAYPLSSLETRRPPPPWTPPSRKEMLNALRNAANDELDLLVVGGGATGAGIAVDAATRGLRVGVVERGDFSSGILVHNQLFRLTFE